jgi:hypothetical protein
MYDYYLRVFCNVILCQKLSESTLEPQIRVLPLWKEVKQK